MNPVIERDEDNMVYYRVKMDPNERNQTIVFIRPQLDLHNGTYMCIGEDETGDTLNTTVSLVIYEGKTSYMSSYVTAQVSYADELQTQFLASIGKKNQHLPD